MARLALQVALAAMLAVGMPGRSEAVDGDPQTPPSTSHTPLWQVEAWYFLQNTTHTTDQQRMTLRLYQPFMLGDGWQLTMREDIRGLDTDQKGVDNPDGLRGAHLGDMFAQASLKTPVMAPGFAVDLGVRVQSPTGNLPPCGTCRFQIGPHLGFIWDLPTPVRMVTLAPLVRYMQSVGDRPANSTETREFQFHPVIAVKPLTGLTVVFWREHPLILDARDDKWFIPFDVMLCYEIVLHLSVGVGVAARLVAHLPQYDNIVYGRVVFSFQPRAPGISASGCSCVERRVIVCFSCSLTICCSVRHRGLCRWRRTRRARPPLISRPPRPSWCGRQRRFWTASAIHWRSRFLLAPPVQFLIADRG